MNKYIQDWLDVIEYMNNDNTYKLAWGRAILENVYTLNHIEEKCETKINQNVQKKTNLKTSLNNLEKIE